MEFTPDGELRLTLALHPASSNSAENFLWQAVMTPDGQVYAGIGQRIFRLDRDRGVWQAVAPPVAHPESKTTWLAGIDREALVYKSNGGLAWSTVIP